jgi:metal-dependent amidase/aminoacylase/carboxypeptidase family protein
VLLFRCLYHNPLTRPQQIHQNPELGYQEKLAHDNITSMLENLGFKVTRHAYGLDTAFVAEAGEGGRVVAFNAEYGK